MRPALRHRKGIPFYHDKTELEFKEDVYERYHEMVLRQSALHLADKFWEGYPFRPILDFAEKHYPNKKDLNILEVGCGVGRWLVSIAKRYPASTCWGIDYSYQMLKRAKEFWIDGKEITIDWTDKGLYQQSIKGEQCKNLNFGLARVEDLPFEENSQELVLSSFLLDRIDQPMKGLEEMYRVVKPQGQLILVSPLNFKKAVHWEKYYPSSKLSNMLKDMGFEILDWKEDIVVKEPLDRHGNFLCWKCLGFVVQK